jgi:hypothetical protein
LYQSRFFKPLQSCFATPRRRFDLLCQVVDGAAVWILRCNGVGEPHNDVLGSSFQSFNVSFDFSLPWLANAAELDGTIV